MLTRRCFLTLCSRCVSLLQLLTCLLNSLALSSSMSLSALSLLSSSLICVTCLSLPGASICLKVSKVQDQGFLMGFLELYNPSLPSLLHPFSLPTFSFLHYFPIFTPSPSSPVSTLHQPSPFRGPTLNPAGLGELCKFPQQVWQSPATKQDNIFFTLNLNISINVKFKPVIYI